MVWLPNPSGVNSWDRFQSEATYGAKQKLQDLERSVPLAGEPTSALNAPRRAQRHATGQDSPQGEGAAAQVLPSPMPGPAPTVQLATVWSEIAADPEASALVREYAQLAARQAGA